MAAGCKAMDVADRRAQSSRNDQPPHPGVRSNRCSTASSLRGHPQAPKNHYEATYRPSPESADKQIKSTLVVASYTGGSSRPIERIATSRRSTISSMSRAVAV